MTYLTFACLVENISGHSVPQNPSEFMFIQAAVFRNLLVGNLGIDEDAIGDTKVVDGCKGNQVAMLRGSRVNKILPEFSRKAFKLTGEVWFWILATGPLISACISMLPSNIASCVCWISSGSFGVRGEKDEYFRAVKCLHTKPSKLGTNHSLYNDFGYAHIQIGTYAHETAGFIAWHRYFIHIYEQTLKHDCGYTGHLVFWDWELDWEDIENAPIWDSEDGFGGNGAEEISVGGGRCVTDGPFANMTLYYYASGEQEHCLSCGFRSGVEKDRLITSRLLPTVLQETFDLQDYRSFSLALEDGAHRAIYAFLQGEFGGFTSPNSMSGQEFFTLILLCFSS